MQFSFVIKDNFALIFAQYYHGLINISTQTPLRLMQVLGLLVRLYDGQPFMFRRITWTCLIQSTNLTYLELATNVPRHLNLITLASVVVCDYSLNENTSTWFVLHF
jgi:hypothetical protein